MNPHTSAGHDTAQPSARRRVVSCGVNIVRTLVVLAAIISLLILASLVLTVAPQASGATRTATTASPSAMCPELTGDYNRIYWGLNEAAGSTFVDDSHADPANRLSVTDNSSTAVLGQVTIGGGTARANDHGLLTSPAAVMSPGTKDFFMCASLNTVTGGDGFNWLQEGQSNGGTDACAGGSSNGQIKFGPNTYVKVQGTLGCAKPLTGVSPNSFNGSAYHTFGVVRHGDYIAVYVDHTSRATVHTVGGIGAVNLSGSADRLSVLGKYIASGNYPADYTVDMCQCAVRELEMGVAP